MIEITDKLVGIWFVQLPGNKGHDDWQAGLTELEPGKFKLQYRFRYADPLEPGADPFEYIDEKTWYAGTMQCSREEGIAGVEKVATHLAAAARSKVYRVMMNPQRDINAFLDEFEKQPWAHFKRVTKEEYEKTHGPVPTRGKP